MKTNPIGALPVELTFIHPRFKVPWRKEQKEKKCERKGCEVLFTPKRSTAKFCSTRCRVHTHLTHQFTQAEE